MAKTKKADEERKVLIPGTALRDASAAGGGGDAGISLRSACDAVLSTYQSLFHGGASDAEADSDGAGASPAVGGGGSAHGRNGEAGPAADEVRRLEAALSALMGGLYRPTPPADSSFAATAVVAAAPVRQCQQRESWDCGIACTQMVLRWLRDSDGESPIRDGGDIAAYGGRSATTTTGARDWDRYGGSETLTRAELIERAWMIDFVETESVWTIDLVVLLERILDRRSREVAGFPGADDPCWQNVRASYLFCSTKLGVDESHSDLGYYRNAFRRDEVRVTGRFQLAEDLGLPTLCVSRLGLDVVVDVVSRRDCAAIVLLDNWVLLHPVADDGGITDARNGLEPGAGEASSCSDAGGGGVEAEIRNGSVSLIETTERGQSSRSSPLRSEGGVASVFSRAPTEQCLPQQSPSETYAGHYVILCGVSSRPDDVARAETRGEGMGALFCMIVKNPNSPFPTEFITPRHFERAWRSVGTDDDIIFIAKHETRFS